MRQQLGHARGYPKFVKGKIRSDHKPPKMFIQFFVRSIMDVVTEYR